MCSECADFGELPDWIWALVFDCPLDLCFETGGVVRWFLCLVCILDGVDFWTKRGDLWVGWWATQMFFFFFLPLGELWGKSC